MLRLWVRYSPTICRLQMKWRGEVEGAVARTVFPASPSSKVLFPEPLAPMTAVSHLCVRCDRDVERPHTQGGDEAGLLLSKLARHMPPSFGFPTSMLHYLYRHPPRAHDCSDAMQDGLLSSI